MQTNKPERLVAIGDIHGDIAKLNSLLDKLDLTKDDTVVFLGDYIDRGENSKEVIERLLRLSKETNCIFLMGNHEEMLLKCVRTKNENDMAVWFMEGGLATYNSYGNVDEIFKLHKDFFKQLRTYYLTEDYLFVHAGIRPDKTLEEQEKFDMLWIRDNFIYAKHKLKQKVIFGHTGFYSPYVENDKIGINTGCGTDDDGYLTAIICGKNEEFITSDNPNPNS